jgi:hypothetical protein
MSPDDGRSGVGATRQAGMLAGAADVAGNFAAFIGYR